MSSYSEHINQAKKNLCFFSNISCHVADCYDWQVTACFYAALHLINAHVVQKRSLSYLSHRLTQDAINPYNEFSVAKLGEDVYSSYISLYQLSRRSRYLVKDKHADKNAGKTMPSSDHANFTYSKHVKRAVNHLNIVMAYMSKNYDVKFEPVTIRCADLAGAQYAFFKIIK